MIRRALLAACLALAFTAVNAQQILGPAFPPGVFANQNARDPASVSKPLVFSEVFTTETALSGTWTFARSGLATQIDANGYLTYAPNNLFLNSAIYAGQTISVTSAQNYIFQAYGPVGATVVLPGSSCGAGATWTGTGPSNLVAVPFTVTSSATSCTFPTQGGAAGAITKVVVCAVTYQTSCPYNATGASAYYGPRFDYDTASTQLGILVENNSRQNLQGYSSTFSNSTWTKSQTSISQTFTGMDNVANSGAIITMTSGSAIHYMAAGGGRVANSQEAISIYAKQGASTPGRYLGISLAASNDGAYAMFDLTTGGITQSAALTSGTKFAAYSVPITSGPMSGGYHLTLVAKTASGTPAPYIFGCGTGTYSANSSGLCTYTAAGETFDIYGAQIEPTTVSYSTSYIPNAYNTSLTRAAETLSATTSAVGYNASTGTLIIETDAQPVDQIGQLGGFDASGGSNAIALYKSATGNIASAGAYANAFETGSTTLSLGSGLDSNNHRGGVSWNTSGGATGLVGSVDGAATASGTVQTPTPTNLYLGYSPIDSALDAHIRTVCIYNTALTGSGLTAETTVGAAC